MKCCCHKDKADDASVPSTSEEDDPTTEEKSCSRFDIHSSELPYMWFPSVRSAQQLDHARKQQCEFESLQKAFLALTTQFAHMQFRLRQILQANPCERDDLLRELEKIAFDGLNDCDDNELPGIQRDLRSMGDVRRKQYSIIEKLRNQMTALSEASRDLEGTEVAEDERAAAKTDKPPAKSKSKLSVNSKKSGTSDSNSTMKDDKKKDEKEAKEKEKELKKKEKEAEKESKRSTSSEKNVSQRPSKSDQKS